MFHVGGARSALYNWIYARQHGGALVLRIEDTDASRNRPEWTEGIIRALAWLGIDEDQYEGPFFQSANTGEHQEAVDRLRDAGRAYFCDCTRDDVIARTGDSYKGYDGHCRDRGLEAGPGRALRFRTPDEGSTVVVDLIRGKPEFENATIEDFVIARGDGSVLFMLANVVDDMTQRITHVIRAEEHLSNTPKQQMLWEALGAQPPDLGARAGRRQREAAEALQAPRQGRSGGLPGGGLPRRGDAQLPDAPRLGAVRRPGDRAVERDRGGVPPRGRPPVPGVLRRQEAAGVQRRVHPRPADRGVRRAVPALAGRAVRPVGAGEVRRGGVRRASPRSRRPAWR